MRPEAGQGPRRAGRHRGRRGDRRGDPEAQRRGPRLRPLQGQRPQALPRGLLRRLRKLTLPYPILYLPPPPQLLTQPTQQTAIPIAAAKDACVASCKAGSLKVRNPEPAPAPLTGGQVCRGACAVTCNSTVLALIQKKCLSVCVSIPFFPSLSLYSRHSLTYSPNTERKVPHELDGVDFARICSQDICTREQGAGIMQPFDMASLIPGMDLAFLIFSFCLFFLSLFYLLANSF